MNQFTFRAIQDALKKYGGRSEYNKYVETKGVDDRFVLSVHSCWWDVIMVERGWLLKQRAVQLWHAFHPEHFTDDGEWLQDKYDGLYDLDVKLSHIAVRALNRWVDQDLASRAFDREAVKTYIADNQVVQLTLF